MNTTNLAIANKLMSQFSDMTDKGIMPLFEIEITHKGEKDYLLVHINATTRGLTFELDTLGMPTHFGDDVISEGGGIYLLLWNECFGGLYHYIEWASDEVNEGFLLPNNLLPTGE